MLKLSIITINYNNLPGLQKTMQSVFDQSFTDYEYIIIDGGSTDGSKEYMLGSADRFSYWISEADRGIYHAMNKAIPHAKGEYILFLNSGDFLWSPEVLSQVFSYGFSEPIVYGNIKWETDGVQTEGEFPSRLTFDYFTRASLPHQASFISRTLFAELGNYEEEFTITADWAFFLNAIYKYNVSYRHIPITIAVCDRHGISCRPETWPLIVEERRKYINRHFYIDKEKPSLRSVIKPFFSRVKRLLKF